MAKVFGEGKSGKFPIDEFLNRKGKPVQALQMDGRTPPQAVDVEQAVLGAILIDPDAIFKAVDLIDDSCFYKPAHRLLMATIMKMVEKNEAIDMVTLVQELRRTNELEDAGGAHYISELTTRVTTSANIEYHARIVLEKFILRRVISIAGELASEAFEGEDDAFEILDKAEKELFQISAERLRKSALSISEILTTAIEKLQHIHENAGGVSGVASSFVDLDKMTGGFQPSDLVIIAARPSMGKTAFAMTVAMNAALKAKKSILVFSLEMSSQSLVERLLYSTAKVDAHLARNGRLPHDDWPKISKAAGKLNEASIYIDDTPGLTVMEIRAKARRLKFEKGIDMIIVDYLQFVHGPKNTQSREQEISAISRSLKMLAKELQVPVLALSQLSRAVESRNPKRPMLSDLRESGAIEQDADVVLFIYRPEFYGEKETEDGAPAEGMAEIIIGKQRNGPTGTVILQFNKQYAAFDNRISTGGFGAPPPGPDAPLNPEDFGAPPPGIVPF